MDVSPPPDAATQANLRKATEALHHAQLMKQQFLQCHDFLAQSTYKLVEMFREAGPGGAGVGEGERVEAVIGWGLPAVAADRRDKPGLERG